MLQMQLSNDAPPLDGAIMAYRNEHSNLEGCLAENPPDLVLIRDALNNSATYLSDIFIQSNIHAQWRGANFEAYTVHRNYLMRTWITHFRHDPLFDRAHIPEMRDNNFQPAPPGPPPPIGVPIAAVQPPGHLEQVGRVLLGIGGIGLLLSGIGALTVGGLEIAVGIAAKKVAKEAGTLAAKEAAKAFARHCFFTGAAYGLSGVVAIGGGVLTMKALAKERRRRFALPPPQPLPLPEGLPNP